MQVSFSEAHTGCPECKHDILLTEIRCPYCNADADTTSSFLSFKRPDGSGGVIDQETATYLRSQHSQPSQKDLDDLFARSTRIQFMEIVFENRIGKYTPRLTLTLEEEFADLQKCITIEATTGHAMTIGEYCLEFYHADEMIARVEIVGFDYLRWSDRWKNDAVLTESIKFAEFWELHGFAKLRILMEQREEEERRLIAEQKIWLASWKPAIPVGLAPLVEELSSEIYSPQPKALPRALAILKAGYPDIDEQILALFAWFGHGVGPWSGYPSSECAPELMLASFSAEQLVRALESRVLSPQHLEGAARFVARWAPRASQQPELVKRFRCSRIRDDILAYIRSGVDSNKTEMVTRVLG